MYMEETGINFQFENNGKEYAVVCKTQHPGDNFFDKDSYKKLNKLSDLENFVKKNPKSFVINNYPDIIDIYKKTITLISFDNNLIEEMKAINQDNTHLKELGNLGYLHQCICEIDKYYTGNRTGTFYVSVVMKKVFPTMFALSSNFSSVDIVSQNISEQLVQSEVPLGFGTKVTGIVLAKAKPYPFSISIGHQDDLFFSDVQLTVENNSLKVHAISVKKIFDPIEHYERAQLNTSLLIEFKPVKDKLFTNENTFNEFGNFVKSKMHNSGVTSEKKYEFFPILLKVHCTGSVLKDDALSNTYNAEAIINDVAEQFGFEKFKEICKSFTARESNIVYDPEFNKSNCLYTLGSWF